MALHCALDLSQQLVLVIAEGEVTLADCEACLCKIKRSEALGWRKLMDLRNAQIALTADEVLAIGSRFREAHLSTSIGALAVVLPNTDSERLKRLLGFLAAAKRPMRIFKTIGRARRWIESLPA
jgi:hypothetical protein